MHYYIFSFFFFNDTATTEIYTLSLHDALPIWHLARLDVEEAGDVLHHEGLIEPGLECLGVGHEAREKLLGVERREDVVEVVRAVLRVQALEGRRHPGRAIQLGERPGARERALVGGLGEPTPRIVQQQSVG